jgi:hypothetical protein
MHLLLIVRHLTGAGYSPTIRMMVGVAYWTNLHPAWVALFDDFQAIGAAIFRPAYQPDLACLPQGKLISGFTSCQAHVIFNRSPAVIDLDLRLGYQITDAVGGMRSQCIRPALPAM